MKIKGDNGSYVVLDKQGDVLRVLVNGNALAISDVDPADFLAAVGKVCGSPAETAAEPEASDDKPTDDTPADETPSEPAPAAKPRRAPRRRATTKPQEVI